MFVPKIQNLKNIFVLAYGRSSWKRVVPLCLVHTDNTTHKEISSITNGKKYIGKSEFIWGLSRGHMEELWGWWAIHLGKGISQDSNLFLGMWLSLETERQSRRNHEHIVHYRRRVSLRGLQTCGSWKLNGLVEQCLSYSFTHLDEAWTNSPSDKLTLTFTHLDEAWANSPSA